MKFKSLLNITHANLNVFINVDKHIQPLEDNTIDENLEIIHQEIYMFNNPDNKKNLKKFINVKGLVPNFSCGKNNAFSQYKIIISQNEFDKLV